MKRRRDYGDDDHHHVDIGHDRPFPSLEVRVKARQHGPSRQDLAEPPPVDPVFDPGPIAGRKGTLLNLGQFPGEFTREILAFMPYPGASLGDGQHIPDLSRCSTRALLQQVKAPLIYAPTGARILRVSLSLGPHLGGLTIQFLSIFARKRANEFTKFLLLF